MFPILYEQITSGTVPQHRGLGTLSDCVSCVVEQERNGKYELVMEYPISGLHAQELAQRRVLKVKPNFTDNPQLFRIDRIGAVMKGNFTVYAKHISYDLSGFEITSGTANNAASACLLLQSAAPGYNITTTKEVAANFTIDRPSSVRSWFAGKKGSFLDVYGTSEIKYDNFDVNFMLHAGQDRGVTIRYGKNLLELSQEGASSNLYTHVLCYYKNGDEPAIVGDKVSTGLTLDVPKTYILDVTSEYETAPSVEQLTARATRFKNENNLTVPSNNITLDFVQSGELKDRVDLCDTVSIYYPALGVTRSNAKCIRTKWDCIREKYIETEFGDVLQDLTDLMVANTGAINSAASDAETAIEYAKSKKRTFLTPPIPPYDKGDIWVFNGVIYACNVARPSGYVNFLGVTTTEIGEGSTENTIVINGVTHTAQYGDLVFYEDSEEETSDYYVWLGEEWTDYATHIIGNDWRLATNYIDEATLESRIKEATEIITGNAKGYIIWHDADGDGHPDEILVVNYPDITDPRCNRIWRWNIGGLGFSTSYAADDYPLALTNDGKINASMIMTGELDASLIKVSNLTADMFKGGEIAVGGIIDAQTGRSYDGALKVYDMNGNLMGEFNKNGIKIYGEGTGNNRAYVLFDGTGMSGYDTNGTKIFWTNKQEFHMRKAVVEEELSCFGIGKFVRLTTYDQNNNVVNDGIALVGI